MRDRRNKIEAEKLILIEPKPISVLEDVVPEITICRELVTQGNFKESLTRLKKLLESV